MEWLDDVGRSSQIRQTIERKSSLRMIYHEAYERFAECLSRCPSDGLAIELGSGGGFAKSLVGDLLTSDVLPYEGIDCVVDGMHLPFPERSIRFLCMMNVFHHISDVARFLGEVERCLVSEGRALIVDQHPGYFGGPILRCLHHEPFMPEAREWAFVSHGPISSANGALAWLVFVRDREEYVRLFPDLEIVRYQPHSPLRYWLAGGMRKWSLLPGGAYGFARRVDHLLMRLSPNFGSFVDVELVKRDGTR